ncbi:hypothetical protein NDU88_003031, partial [Pleurodeles waltl]
MWFPWVIRAGPSGVDERAGEVRRRLETRSISVGLLAVGGLRPLAARRWIEDTCVDWWSRGGPLVSLLPWFLEFVTGWIGPEEAETGR